MDGPANLIHISGQPLDEFSFSSDRINAWANMSSFRRATYLLRTQVYEMNSRGCTKFEILSTLEQFAGKLECQKNIKVMIATSVDPSFQATAEHSREMPRCFLCWTRYSVRNPNNAQVSTTVTNYKKADFQSQTNRGRS